MIGIKNILSKVDNIKIKGTNRSPFLLVCIYDVRY